MKTSLTIILCAALVPVAALGFSDYVDEALAALGVTTAAGPDRPAATAPAKATTPPATKVKTEYIPYGEEATALYLTSTPAAAPVTVDGRAAGVTPLLLTDLPPGKHSVSVANVADEVDLRAGGVTRIDVSCAAPAAPAPSLINNNANYVDNSTSYFKVVIDD